MGKARTEEEAVACATRAPLQADQRWTRQICISASTAVPIHPSTKPSLSPSLLSLLYTLQANFSPSCACTRYKPTPRTVDDISLNSDDVDVDDIQLSDSDGPDEELRPRSSSAQKLFGGKSSDGGGLGGGLKRNTALKPKQMLAKSGKAGETARIKEVEKEKVREQEREKARREEEARDLPISSPEAEDGPPIPRFDFHGCFLFLSLELRLTFCSVCVATFAACFMASPLQP